jgi:hypothetical protein
MPPHHPCRSTTHAVPPPMPLHHPRRPTLRMAISHAERPFVRVYPSPQLDHLRPEQLARLSNMEPRAQVRDDPLRDEPLRAMPQHRICTRASHTTPLHHLPMTAAPHLRCTSYTPPSDPTSHPAPPSYDGSSSSTVGSHTLTVASRSLASSPSPAKATRSRLMGRILCSLRHRSSCRSMAACRGSRSTFWSKWAHRALDGSTPTRCAPGALHACVRDLRTRRTCAPPRQCSFCLSLWAQFGLYGLGAQPAQLGAFVYSDKSDGGGRGVYFRLIPGAAIPKVIHHHLLPRSPSPTHLHPHPHPHHTSLPMHGRCRSPSPSPTGRRRCQSSCRRMPP